MARDFEQEFEELGEWADQFLKCAENGFPVKTRPHEDHLAFMALTFLAKQVEHLQSIRKLGLSLDTGLIARSMIDGLIQLRWAQTHDKALHWRTFLCIADYRLLLTGHDPSQKERVEDFFRQHERKFRKKKYEADDNPPIKDAYHSNWRCGTKINEMCPEDLIFMYREVYDGFSDWCHWGPLSAAGCLESVPGPRFVFAPNSAQLTGLALSTGILCLALTAKIVDSCIEDQPFKAMEELSGKYTKWGKEKLGVPPSTEDGCAG